MTDKYFMDLANLEGKKALKRGDYPCGCIVVKKGKLISKSSSQGITKNDVTAHAEIIAIRKACKKLKSRFLDNCVLYTNIEPCLMCGKAIVYSRIKRIVYGANHMEYNNKKTFDILKRNGIGKNIKIIKGLEKNIANMLLKEFLKMNRK